MTIDSPADLAAIVSILGGMAAGILYLIRSQNALNREFKPNHGNSTKDVLVKIDRDLRDVRNRLDRHIDQHNERP